MSTESSASAPVRRGSFGRTLAAMITVLVVLCTGLAVLTLGQGPRLVRSDIDTDSVVQLAQQRLLMHSNEPLAEIAAEQVSVTPSIPLTVATDGSTLSITFDQRLLYGTDYVVSVSGVTSPFQEAASTFDYSFTTGSPPIYYLQKGAPGAAGGADDAIVRTTVSGTVRDVVYAAPRIQDFAVVGSSLAIATETADGLSQLMLVAPGQAAVETLPLPTRGTITQLGSSVKQAMLGFRFTSVDPAAGYSNTLLVFDLLAKHASFTLPGTVIGEALRVDQWRFIPDSTLIETTADGVMSIYDSALQQGAVIGDYDSLGEVAPAGKQSVIGGQGAFHTLDLLSGQVSPLAPILPEGASALGLPLLGPDGSTTVSMASATADDGTTRQIVVRSDSSGATMVFDTASGDARIVSVVQSPNTQYLAIAVEPRPGAEIVTSLVDRSTGAVVRTLSGLRVTWP
ncbi:Ig-like domain-containing protein [Agreia sp. Leaf335]|uniref:Ig-like domain-containing protein n=1 Tax=Agreia sp. Leaf335 TaxID=1736340 RepID=UPI000AA35998|nr:Ig-like domain-containing protein [Agreia sp. Leaf335]